MGQRNLRLAVDFDRHGVPSLGEQRTGLVTSAFIGWVSMQEVVALAGRVRRNERVARFEVCDDGLYIIVEPKQ